MDLSQGGSFLKEVVKKNVNNNKQPRIILQRQYAFENINNTEELNDEKKERKKIKISKIKNR